MRNIQKHSIKNGRKLKMPNYQKAYTFLGNFDDIHMVESLKDRKPVGQITKMLHFLERLSIEAEYQIAKNPKSI